jgi:hypothetical protein
MNTELRKKWLDMIELFIEVDKKSEELIPEDEEGEWVDKTKNYIEENATQKVVDQGNVFLNRNNWNWKRVSEGPYNKDKRLIFLPSLGYLKRSKSDVIYENELFKNDTKLHKLDLDEITISCLAEGETLIEKLNSLEKKSKDFSEKVNDIYSKLLIGAPELIFEISKHIKPENGNVYSWYIKNSNYYEILPINNLSLAQYRWAILSIKIALKVHTTYFVYNRDFRSYSKDLLFIDEPESALHITAQQHLVDGLSWLAKEYDFQIFLSKLLLTFVRCCIILYLNVKGPCTISKRSACIRCIIWNIDRISPINIVISVTFQGIFLILVS